jgi:hypothetical protein
VDGAAGRTPGRSAPVWLTLVGIPTAYLLLSLILATIDGIMHDSSSVVESLTLIVLAATPLGVWIVSYQATRDRFPRKSCGALYATSLAFFVGVVALAGVIAMTWSSLLF